MLFLTALGGGALVGWLIGAAALELHAYTQGWDQHDGRYLYLIGAMAWAQGMLFGVAWIGVRPSLRYLAGLAMLALVLLGAALLLMGLAWLLAVIPGSRGQSAMVPLPLALGLAPRCSPSSWSAL